MIRHTLASAYLIDFLDMKNAIWCSLPSLTLSDHHDASDVNSSIHYLLLLYAPKKLLNGGSITRSVLNALPVNSHWSKKGHFAHFLFSIATFSCLHLRCSSYRMWRAALENTIGYAAILKAIKRGLWKTKVNNKQPWYSVFVQFITINYHQLM